METLNLIVTLALPLAFLGFAIYTKMMKLRKDEE
jgi:hypothetical protein